MKRMFTSLMGGTLVIALAVPLSAQSIDTGPADFRTTGFGYDYTLWGQTFTAPTADALLTSIAFDLGNVASSFSFRSYIHTWNGSTWGDRLWTGSLQTLAAGSSGYQTLSTDGLRLSPGAMYIAYLESDRPQFGYASGTIRAGVTRDSYMGGELVASNGRYLEIYDGTSGFDANGNQHLESRFDAAFRAEFSDATVTPEPVSMALLGTGLAGLGAVRRRRRREAEKA